MKNKSQDDQPNNPEDSRRLKIAQNFVLADVNTAADVSKINAAEDADEDEKLEYTSTKEDTVFNAYVTIATVYAAWEEPQSWRDQEPRFPCRLEEALTEVSSLGLTTGPSKLPTSSSRDATSGLCTS